MNIAVIFAGGVGSRMKTGGLPKQFLEVNGKPILVHTLEVFQNHEEIDAIILVMVKDWLEHTRELLEEYGLDKVIDVVPGGKTGQESIYRGLLCAKEHVRELEGDGSEYKTTVLIHDGVRPMIDAELISANIAGVREHGSAITCVPCNETVVMVDEDGDRIIRTVERAKTRIAKAPQSFRLADILHAHERAILLGRDDIVDSCTMMQLYGAVVPSVIPGSFDNIKVTTPGDYYTLKTLLDVRDGKLQEV